MRAILPATLLALALLVVPTGVASQPEDTYVSLNAPDPRPWTCGGAGPSPQSILNDHLNWHCTYPDSTWGSNNGGARFLGYHRQMILNYDIWRTTAPNNYPRIQTWNPSSGVVPFAHDCLNGVNRAANAPGSFSALPNSFTPPNLYTYTPQSLGTGIVTWHNNIHNQIRNMDAQPSQGGLQQCTDMGDPARAPRDPIFWRFHKMLDDVYSEWQRGMPADVVVVLDRSGSMGQTTAGGTKWDEAEGAAGLFADLLKENAGHKLGLVTFSSSATRDYPLTNVVPGTDNAFNAQVQATSVYGATSIGDGLQKAMDELNQNGDPNNRDVIILMTDGKQNTAPMISAVEGSLGQRQVCTVGFGSGSNLDGSILTRLAERQAGVYVSTPDPLQMKKFFVTCYASLFDAFESTDPIYKLAQGQTASPTLRTRASSTDRELTFVAGWDGAVSSGAIRLQVTTPSGAVLNVGAAGVEESVGPSWTFVRVKLPAGADHVGEWKVKAVRKGDDAERRVFLSTLTAGSGRVEGANPTPIYYKGEFVKPTFRIPAPSVSNPRGYLDVNAVVHVRRPAVDATPPMDDSRDGLSSPVGPRTSTQDPLGGSPSTEVYVELTPETYVLRDDGTGGDDVAGDNYFTATIPERLVAAGDYTFHAVFTMAEPHPEMPWETETVTREATYTVHVLDETRPLATDDTTAPRSETMAESSAPWWTGTLLLAGWVGRAAFRRGRA
ncbi:MAG TPA: VWA domain-containing protein [Candidatus Thermoplasmatota archaeon]|nr:VWA domain-containing protein [Candidatus Thermoplasmatota archaeon]